MRGGKPLTLNAIGSGECFQRPAEAHEQFEKRSVVGAVGSIFCLLVLTAVPLHRAMERDLTSVTATA